MLKDVNMVKLKPAKNQHVSIVTVIVTEQLN